MVWGGGNCVKIRHNSTYETIYAHMSKFARGIKEGKKVKQGQIIGYVALQVYLLVPIFIMKWLLMEKKLIHKN